MTPWGKSKTLHRKSCKNNPKKPETEEKKQTCPDCLENYKELIIND